MAEPQVQTQVETTIDAVKVKYGAVAESTLSSDHAGVKAVAEAFGYNRRRAHLYPGSRKHGALLRQSHRHRAPETWRGRGRSRLRRRPRCLLAAQKIGPTGRAIGIDMTPEMIERARANAATGGYTNVEFHLAPIDRLPLPDASADCVISNCVLNLAPDKPAVFREIFRVLKPGGRLAVSDIALKSDLPESIATSLAAYVGCIGGAIRIDDYRTELRKAGFEFVEIVDSHADLNAYAKVEGQSGCCSPGMRESAGATPAAHPDESKTLHQDLAAMLSSYDVNSAAASVKVYAIKPAANSCCGPACCA